MSSKTPGPKSYGVLLALAALLLTARAALAQAWPQRQAIEVTVPLSAGSATDIRARVMAEELEPRLSQSIAAH